MKLEYFKINEFDSPDLPNSGINMDSNFLSMLDNARHIAQIPFKINSGFRTKEWNEKLPDAKPKSSHLIGKAADISVKNSRERWIILNALIQVGFNRIGIANTFIHVDSDQNKSSNVIWIY